MPPDPPATSWVTGAVDPCALGTDEAGQPHDPFDDLDFETASLEDGIEALAHATEFGTYRTGLGSSPDPGVIVLEEILRQPDAIMYLDRLWVQGTPAARLYAVCGFYVADLERFEWTSRSLFKRSECVDFRDSCLGFRVSMVAALHSAAAAGLLNDLRENAESRRWDEPERATAAKKIDSSGTERMAREFSAWLSCGAVVTRESAGPAPWTCVHDAWGGITLGRASVGPEWVVVPLTLGNQPRRHRDAFVCVRRVTTDFDRGRLLVSLRSGSCGPGAMMDLEAHFRRPTPGRYDIVYDDAGAHFPKLGEVAVE